MKLHLPKALLTAIVAAGLAFSSAYAEEITPVTKSTDLTYTGTIYTLGAKDTGDSLLAGSVYETTLVPAADGVEASWKPSDTATSTASNKWAALYAEGTVGGTNYASYNTLRVTLNDEYKYQFSALSMAGIIVEDGVDGASFVSSNGSNRNIYIGKTGVSGNSYFGGSFTFDNTSSNDNTNTIIKVDGTQNWYIAAGKTVTLKANEGVVNNATWTINGGTVEITNGLTTISTIYSNDSTFKHSGGVVKINAGVVALDAVGTVEYSDGDDGYIKGDFYLVKGTGSASSVASTVTDVTGKNYAVQANDGNLIISADDTATGGYYYVNTEKNYGDENSAIMADTTTGIAMNGGKLNLNTGLKDGVNIATMKEGSTINLASGVTLNRASITQSAYTSALSGAGIYDLGNVGKGGNTNLNLNVNLDSSAWSGTVRLSGGTFTETSSNNEQSVQNLNFNALGNSASVVEIAEDGVYGYLAGGGSTTTEINTNIRLTGNLTLQNGNSGTTHKFAGKMMGDGDFVIAKTTSNTSNGGGSTNNTFEFKGDISDWNGSIINKDNNGTNGNDLDSTIVLSGSATNVNVAIDGSAGILNLKVDNAAKTTTFNKNVTVNNMELTAGTKIADKSDDSVSITVNNTLTVNAADSIQLAGSLLFGDGATLTLSDTLAQTIVNGTQTSYTLAIAGDITEGVRLTTALNLDGSKFTDYALSVQDYVSTQARSGDTAGKALVLTLTPMAEVLDTLTVTSVGTYDATDNVLTLNTQLVEGAFELDTELDVAFTGDTWEQALAAIVGAEGDAAEVSVQFTMANGELIDLAGVTSLTVNGIAPVGGVTVIEGTKASAYLIPEPTTSTLSLLALAALAVRRRRR